MNRFSEKKSINTKTIYPNQPKVCSFDIDWVI